MILHIKTEHADFYIESNNITIPNPTGRDIEFKQFWFVIDNQKFRLEDYITHNFIIGTEIKHLKHWEIC